MSMHCPSLHVNSPAAHVVNLINFTWIKVVSNINFTFTKMARSTTLGSRCSSWSPDYQKVSKLILASQRTFFGVRTVLYFLMLELTLHGDITDKDEIWPGWGIGWHGLTLDCPTPTWHLSSRTLEKSTLCTPLRLICKAATDLDRKRRQICGNLAKESPQVKSSQRQRWDPCDRTWMVNQSGNGVVYSVNLDLTDIVCI